MVKQGSDDDLRTGGGYRDFETRELHRLWYRAYVVSGSKSGALITKEKTSPAFKRYVEYMKNNKTFKMDILTDFYNQRIKAGVDFYGNRKQRVPNTWTNRNIKKFGNYKPKESAKVPALKASSKKFNKGEFPATLTKADVVKFKSINKAKAMKASSKPRRNIKLEPVVSRADRLKAQRKAQMRASMMKRTGSTPFVQPKVPALKASSKPRRNIKLEKPYF